MAKWFTSDLHFGHVNVIEYCDRPYKNIEEMNAAIIAQWNSQVKPQDEVYFLGDFGINPKTVLNFELVKKLNGIKYIIPGNHDFGFKELHSKNKTLRERINKVSDQYKEAGWSSVFPIMGIILKNGMIAHLTHIPPDSSIDSRYSEFKIQNNPEFIYLHGHLHGHYRKKNNMIDVCFDAELCLISEDEVIALIEDSRDFIPTRLTDKYKSNNLFLMPFEAEVKKGYVTKKINGNLVLFDYNDKCTYDKAWNDVTVYSRGIVFNRNTGEVVAAPLNKFFNFSELMQESDFKKLNEKK